MTQEIVVVEECKYCGAFVQYQGQGHWCPDEEAGSGKDEPSEEFLFVIEKIKTGTKFFIKETYEPQ